AGAERDRERQPGEQRRGPGLGRAEADAGLLVEHLEQRYLAGLVARREPLAELPPRVATRPRSHRVQRLDRAEQLAGDRLAEHGGGRRLEQVDLEQPARVDPGRQAVREVALDRAI